MQGDKSHVRRPRAGVAVALVAGYAASVLLSALVSRVGGAAATLWAANGFLTAAFILLPWPRRIGVAVACLAFQAALSLAVGDGVVGSALYPLINLLEGALAGWLAIRFCGVRARRLSLRELALVPIAAIAPAVAVAGVVGAAADFMLKGTPPLYGWLAWTIPGGLGMSIILPAVLLAARAGQYREFNRSPLETAAILGGFCVLVAAVFLQGYLPLQFVVFPALTVIAVRLGPPGAATASLAMAMISLPLTMFGFGPSALAHRFDPVGRVYLTEFVVATAMISALATAVAVGEQTRLRRLMLGRDRVAREARLRARRAERAAAEAQSARVQGKQAKPRERVAGLV